MRTGFGFPGRSGLADRWYSPAASLAVCLRCLAAIIRPSTSHLSIRDDASVLQYVHSCL